MENSETGDIGIVAFVICMASLTLYIFMLIA